MTLWALPVPLLVIGTATFMYLTAGKCLLGHSWGWPRRRGDVDVQVCTECGTERVSDVQFPTVELSRRAS